MDSLEEFRRQLVIERERRDWSHRDVAKRIGISQAAYSKIESGLTRKSRYLSDLAALFGLDLPKSDLARIGREALEAVKRSRPLATAPVPVMGWAAGHKGADFLVRSDIQEYVPRPEGLSERLPIYALYVTNTSMVPRFKPNKLIFVQQHKAPSPGDDVVIQVSQGPHDAEISGYVKTFVRKTQKKWICEQLNPKKVVEFDVGDVISVDRVIPEKELPA